MSKKQHAKSIYSPWRESFTLLVFALMAVSLIGRAVYLQVIAKDKLVGQGDARHLRIAKLSAHRGTIYDRHGEPLAVSTPVDSIWANPQEFAEKVDQIDALAAAVNRDSQWLLRRITQNMHREFVYLRRHMPPVEASAVLDLGLPGIYTLREYRRYYPAGEVAGHLIGFTDVDDQGLEGIELAFDAWLRGESGAKRVMKDRLGQIIANVESIRAPEPGKDLVTSIDLNIQYLAYRELMRAVRRHDAKSGSVVVVDIPTGEVLAMVNQPGYNPNDRNQFNASRYRNRAATDIFEPGSSLKPFIAAAALESGQYSPASPIATAPGYMKVEQLLVEDVANFGDLDLTGVLTKSSNVGVVKVAMSMEAEQLWQTLSRLGIGELTTSGFPGESAGLLTSFQHWGSITQATLAFGYGVSVTPLQLAQAYATLGSGGVHRPVSFVVRENDSLDRRVMDASIAAQVIEMLETVTQEGGTGTLAAVNGYRVAGKTGTTKKFTAGGYADGQYVSVFAGIAPASAPRFAVVVVIEEPNAGDYYGGDVAAPVFANVMSNSLRLLSVVPDTDDPAQQRQLVHERFNRHNGIQADAQ
ncbi:MAG: penicillin-binding transpeptidase domain-containing protein [Pseudomonadota bacterium]